MFFPPVLAGSISLDWPFIIFFLLSGKVHVFLLLLLLLLLIIIIIIIIIISLLVCFSHPDWPQVSSGLQESSHYSSNGVVWIVSIRSPMSNFSSPFSKLLGPFLEHQWQLVSLSPSYSAAFSILWQGLNTFFFLRFLSFSLCDPLEQTRKFMIQQFLFFLFLFFLIIGRSWLIIIILYASFQTRKKLVAFIAIWVIASLFRCPGRFSVFLPILVMQGSGRSQSFHGSPFPSVSFFSSLESFKRSRL